MKWRTTKLYQMSKDPFKNYIKESEPDRWYKGYAWQTAIGLQKVDGLTPSDYLIRTAVRNIEGEISIEEVDALLQSYYKENLSDGSRLRTEEADKVSARIVGLLSEEAFSFSPSEYLSIHRRLFTGVYPHAGRIRDYNITKKEWTLDGATVLYGSAAELRATMEYDFSEEKKFSYKSLSTDEIIHHLAVFVSRLWQIHIFGEGNTRTTAVFSLNTYELSAMTSQMMFSPRMHGIFETHLFGLIIMTLRMVSMKQRSISNCFFAISY